MQEGLLELSSNGSKEYSNRMLTGGNIVTGSSNCRIVNKPIIQNLGGISNSEKFENDSMSDREVLLCRIEDLRARLNNCSISYKEKQTIKGHFDSLYTAFEEKFGKGLSKSIRR